MPTKDPRQYARMAVDLPSNRKLAGAPAHAKWLSVVGILWSTQNLTDGQVDPAVMAAVAKVPARHVRELINRGVWHEQGHTCPDCSQPVVADEVTIHHYEKHQDSAETVRRNRDEKAKSGRLANHLRWKHVGPIEECPKCND